MMMIIKDSEIKELLNMPYVEYVTIEKINTKYGVIGERARVHYGRIPDDYEMPACSKLTEKDKQ